MSLSPLCRQNATRSSFCDGHAKKWDCTGPLAGSNLPSGKRARTAYPRSWPSLPVPGNRVSKNAKLISGSFFVSAAEAGPDTGHQVRAGDSSPALTVFWFRSPGLMRGLSRFDHSAGAYAPYAGSGRVALEGVEGVALGLGPQSADPRDADQLAALDQHRDLGVGLDRAGGDGADGLQRDLALVLLAVEARVGDLAGRDRGDVVLEVVERLGRGDHVADDGAVGVRDEVGVAVLDVAGLLLDGRLGAGVLHDEDPGLVLDDLHEVAVVGGLGLDELAGLLVDAGLGVRE